MDWKQAYRFLVSIVTESLVVLVSGASGGLGSAMVAELLGRGAHVFAGMRSPDACSDLAGTPCQSAKLTVVNLDVRSRASVDNAVDAVFEKAGRLDAVINSAGVARVGAVEDLSDEDVAMVMDTNFLGAFRVCRAALPVIRRSGGGTIVNISSVAGLIAPPFVTPYSASKHALEAFSEGLAAEVRPFGVRVILIEPGFLATKFAERLDCGQPGPIYRERVEHVVSMHRDGAARGDDPRTVAGTVADLIDNDRAPIRVPAGAAVDMFRERKARLSDDAFAAFVAHCYGA
jgi:NAD(P)-dependent dehydrogenase (short-subunit alcohol dehydrogenase family)